ncbi:unnamed protein product [Echinostoma caproni]|uniref:Reverse transcriptase domain-containing protein n=1 Tax=Echinostoma caproni TaxID=27848 RepID=A0A3P8F3Q8_9TREM|nr:unnamed protein product [Echinostoma caproni]
MSPLLYIVCFDEVLQLSNPSIAFSSPAGPIDAMAYADDLIVFADSSAALQRKLTACQDAWSAAGFSLNAPAYSLPRIPVMEIPLLTLTARLSQQPVLVNGSEVLSTDEAATRMADALYNTIDGKVLSCHKYSGPSSR